jgi:hypothetical protein
MLQQTPGNVVGIAGGCTLHALSTLDQAAPVSQGPTKNVSEYTAAEMQANSSLSSALPTKQNWEQCNNSHKKSLKEYQQTNKYHLVGTR